MKVRTLAVGALTAALAASIGVSAPAFADAPKVGPTTNAACPNGGTTYRTVGDDYTFTRAAGNQAVVSGDPGVTLQISKTISFTVGGTLGGNTTVSASAVVLTVQQQLNYSITGSYTATSSNSGAWTVPATYTNGGRLEIGARKHTGWVYKYQLTATCSLGNQIGSGANYNAPEEGWYFKRSKL